ncbi:MAG: thioredoxin [Clostridia bacterium]
MSKFVDLDEQSFEQLVGEESLTVVDFWAKWCGPCRMIAPILEQVSVGYPEVNFGKVNVDEAEKLAVRYEISSIPNICFFKKGVLVDREIGVCSASDLKKIIDKNK